MMNQPNPFRSLAEQMEAYAEEHPLDVVNAKFKRETMEPYARQIELEGSEVRLQFTHSSLGVRKARHLSVSRTDCETLSEKQIQIVREAFCMENAMSVPSIHPHVRQFIELPT